MTGKFQGMLRGTIEFLRSRESILVVLVMALMAQLPHTAVVFHRLSTTMSVWLVPGTPVNVGAGVDWLHAYVAAISIELAVLMFVVRGKILLSWLFALCSIAMNMIYYWQAEAGWLQSVPFWGALLWAAILPVAIAFYSHEIGNGETESKRDVAGATEKKARQTVVSAPQAPKVESSVNTPETSTQPLVAPPKTPQTPKMPKVPSAPNAVTKRERALMLLGEGLTYPQVAQELGVAETTVRGYVFKSKQEKPQGQELETER